MSHSRLTKTSYIYIDKSIFDMQKSEDEQIHKPVVHEFDPKKVMA